MFSKHPLSPQGHHFILKIIPTSMNTDELLRIISNKKKKSIKDAENFRKEIVKKLDKQIDELYKKKDFFTEIWANKNVLRKYKKGVWAKMLGDSFWWNVRYIVSMPFIYIIIIPSIILHVFVEIYHHICFPLYGIPLVEPKEYFIFDRKKLPYLNWLEKFNCLYCSYFNGLLGYIQEISGRTERYWCPIKHAKRMKAQHSQYALFVEYGDGQNLRSEWKKLKKFDKN